MKPLHPHLNWIVPAVFVLALAAALAGLLWPGEGQPYPMTSFRGEQVTINARGLYRWDTLSSAAQMQANDTVTLFLALPLLAVSFWLARRGSLRGQLLLTGTLGFILYTYITMCFGAAFNPFFPVYVALFSLSLFAVVLAMFSFDLETLPSRFSDRLPRKAVAGLLFVVTAFLGMAWLGRIAAAYQGQTPLLENVTSMFIQAMDLGIIVPVSALAGVLLLKRSAWGYLLASVMLVKGITLGLAVALMALNMARVGVPISLIELVVFPLFAVANAAMAVTLLRNILPAGSVQAAMA